MTEEKRKYHREYQRKNRERVSENSRRHRETDKYKESRKTEEFRQRARAYSKKFRENNPEKTKLLRKKYSTRNIWFKRIGGRDGFLCRECKTTEGLTLEHKKPKSIGGLYSYENLEILCSSCNRNVYNQLVKTALRIYFKNQQTKNINHIEI